MKITWTLLIFSLLVSFVFAFPVASTLNGLQLEDTKNEEVLPYVPDLQKRDIVALTYLFKTLNTTGTGVALVETAISVSLTQQQVIKFVGNLIKTKGLTNLLEAAKTSELALDVVLMVLTHYEVIPGLTNIIKAYKGESSYSSSSSNSSLLSGLLSSNASDGTDSVSLSADYSALEGLLGSSATADFSSLASLTTATINSESSTTGENAIDLLLQGIGLNLALQETTYDSTLFDNAVVTTSPSVSNIDTTSTQTTTTATSSETSTGSLLGSLLGILLKRSDIDDLQRAELVRSLSNNEHFGREFESLTSSSSEDEYTEGSRIAERDLIDTVYLQIILLIGTNSNIELVAESLAKSGLGVSVIYEALTNDNYVDFDVNLVKYLVEKDIVTLSSLLSAVIQSGLLTSILGDLVSNSTYRQLVINFILAIITGKINIIGLIAALF